MSRVRGLGHATGYGLERGHSRVRQIVAETLWTLTLGAGAILLAGALTYAAMRMGLPGPGL